MIYYLIYVSKSTLPMNADQLLVLLDNARAWNGTHKLSGMLLYIEGEPKRRLAGRFMQVLEGDEKDVKEIYEKIKTDSRHHLITILNQGQLEVRNFESWCMGFESVKSEDIRKHPGYIELNNAFLSKFGRNRFNFALNYLKSFYELRSTIC